jgi:DMSO/TMAO reductase YedYZ molybdopterin-dependent catalytic subunit
MVALRNTGTTTCGAPLAKHVPTPEAHQALTVGPCGALPLIVRSTHGRTVYPGPAVFFCPEESGFQLAPHSSAQATASWSQTAYVGTGTAAKPQQAPPGPYRLTVDGVVTVPLTLTSG